MKNLNVSIEDDVMEAVKDAANRDGMLLRKWVERALQEAAEKAKEKRTLALRERTYEPIE